LTGRANEPWTGRAVSFKLSGVEGPWEPSPGTRSLMRVQVRIVAGGPPARKLTAESRPDLRPAPQMVPAARFRLLGDAAPRRPFYDVFAGTGVVGLEALSGGAKAAEFIERDFRLGQEIDRHLKTFDFAAEGTVRRADAYRWVEHWEAPAEPVNVFVSPPFPDL